MCRNADWAAKPNRRRNMKPPYWERPQRGRMHYGSMCSASLRPDLLIFSLTDGLQPAIGGRCAAGYRRLDGFAASPPLEFVFRHTLYNNKQDVF